MWSTRWRHRVRIIQLAQSHWPTAPSTFGTFVARRTLFAEDNRFSKSTDFSNEIIRTEQLVSVESDAHILSLLFIIKFHGSTWALSASLQSLSSDVRSLGPCALKETSSDYQRHRDFEFTNWLSHTPTQTKRNDSNTNTMFVRAEINTCDVCEGQRKKNYSSNL